MKWALPLILVLGLAGCTGKGVDVHALELQTMDAINQSQVKGRSKILVTRVTLVLESGNKYTGFFDANDGTRHPLTVTYDGTKLIYDMTH